MRVNDLVKIAIVVILLSLLINLYVAYNIKYNLEKEPGASPKSVLYYGFGYLRVLLDLSMVMFIQEYLTYEIRSGYTALLMKTGIGLKKYLLEKIMFFTMIALLLTVPTYYVLSPLIEYNDVIFCCLLGDLFTIIMYSFIISFILPNAFAVIIGGLLLTYLSRIHLSIFLYKIFKSTLVFYFLDPVSLWFIDNNCIVKKHILHVSTLIYIVSMLMILYLVIIKVASRRPWK